MDQAEHDRIVADLNAKLTDATTKLTASTTELATRTTELKAATDRLTAIETAAADKAKGERVEAVKTLFKALAVEYKDDDAKPYIEMTAEQFTAVSKQMQKRSTLDDVLFRQQADGGSSGSVDLANSQSILAAARTYIAEQKKVGLTVEIHEAVTHVTLAAKQGVAA